MNLTIKKIQEVEANQLTAREINILVLGLAFKPAEIAEIYGVTRQRVEQIRDTAKVKLKKQGVK